MQAVEDVATTITRPNGQLYSLYETNSYYWCERYANMSCLSAVGPELCVQQLTSPTPPDPGQSQGLGQEEQQQQDGGGGGSDGPPLKKILPPAIIGGAYTRVPWVQSSLGEPPTRAVRQAIGAAAMDTCRAMY